MGNFKWLHLSDLHFRMCEGFDMSLILDQLTTTLKEQTENEKFKFIFITGDLADRYDYSVVEPRVRNLLLNSDILANDGRIFWVCGNHDIPREKNWRNKEIANIRNKALKETTFESEFSKEESRFLLLNAFNTYYEKRAFLFGLETPKDYPHQVVHTDDAEIVLLNTCITSCDDEDEHKLYLCESKLIELFNEIEPGKPIFVLGHHSLHYLDDSDRTKLLKLFREKNISVYLCGHAHQLGVYPLSEEIQEIVSGGFKTDGYAVISFIIGEFNEDSCEYTLIPYTYRTGSKTWADDYAAISGMEKDKKYKISLSDAKIDANLSENIIRAAKAFQNITNIDHMDITIFNRIGKQILQKYVQMRSNAANVGNISFEDLCELAIQYGNQKINYPSLQMKNTMKDIWRFQDNCVRILTELGENNVNFTPLTEPLFDFNDFYEQVNRFDVAENLYILITDAMHDLDNEHKRILTALQWDMIFDYDGYSDKEGLRNSAQRQNIKDLNGNYLILRDSILRKGITSWIRIGGQIQFSLHNTDSQLNLKELKKIFETLSKKLYENTNGSIIFVFIKDIDVYDRELMRIIWERFGSKSRFIMAGAYNKQYLKKQFQNLFLDSYGRPVTDCYEIYQTSLKQFIRKYNKYSENFLESKKYESMQFPSDNGLVKMDQNLFVNLGDFFEVLIADIGIDRKHLQEDMEAFYLGGEAAWSLFYSKDILELMEPDIMDDFINRIKTALGAKQSQYRKAIFYLLHDAGFGGTTVAKGIAWKMHREYPTLILKNYEYGKIKPLVQNLYDNHSKKGILILADESHFSISELENLEQELGLVDRPFALLVVRRSNWGKTGNNSANTKKLNSLTKTMVSTLRSRFESHSSLEEDILKEKNDHFDEIFPQNSGMRCPFLIGLYYQDKHFNGVSLYVERIIREISSKDELKLLLILAVINYYGRIGVIKEIIKKYVSLLNNSSYLEKYPYAKDAFIEIYDETLQVRVYREKHPLISEELIKQCSEKLYGSGYQENLKDALVDLIKKLLEINSEGITIYYKNLIERLFIYKNATDVDENGYTDVQEFSPLILALPSQSSKEEVMCTLAKGVKEIVNRIPVEENLLYFKTAAHICGHMGRLYKASTAIENNKKSVEWCQYAEEIMKKGGFEDAYIYHMHGTSLSKRCQDSLSMWKEDMTLCSDKMISDLEATMIEAIDKFDQTIYAGEFVRGCISKLSLLMEYMQFLMQWKNIQSSDGINKLSEQERDYLKSIEDLINMLQEVVLDPKDEKRLQNFNYKYKAEIMFNNYGKAIEYYTNSISNVINQKGEDAEELYVLRSGLVGAILGKYFQEDGNPYLKMEKNDVERILEALEKNIFSTVVISDRWERQRRCNDCHRWLKVAKHSTKPVHTGIKVAEKWKELQQGIELKDPRPFYYLAILNYLNALDGYPGSLDIARVNHKEAYRIACNNSSFRVIKTEKIRDILVEGKGMSRIRNVVDLSEDLVQNSNNLIKIRGRFEEIENNSKRNIGKIKITYPQELKNIMVSFKMGDKNVIGINQSTHLLEFGMGFTFERLEAINSTVKDITAQKNEEAKG